MWPILLKILTIIGFVLAGILALILLLLLIVLFCPITYRASGSIHGGKYNVNARINYLFGLVKSRAEFPEPGRAYVKIFWLTVFDTQNDTDTSDETADSDKSGKSEQLNKTKEFNNSNELNNPNELSDSKDLNHSNDSDKSNLSENLNDVRTEKIAETPSDNEKKDSDLSRTNKKEKKKKNKKPLKIYNPIYYIKKGRENFRHKIISKIKSIIRDIKFYKKLLEHEDTVRLINKFKKRLLKILKIIAPKNGRLDLNFGFESPDTTGIIYGIYTSVFVKWPKYFNVVPDFEKKTAEGDADISGHFILFRLVLQVLPILLSRDLKRTRARINNHISRNDVIKAKENKKHDNIIKELNADYL